MARRPWRPSPRALAIAALLALPLAWIAHLYLRTWQRDRLLLPGPPALVLWERGNALGSRCEIEEEGRSDEVVVYPCDVEAHVPELGSHTDALRVLRSDHTTCAVTRAPLRELGCVDFVPAWMVSSPSHLSLGSADGGDIRVVSFDRVSGARTETSVHARVANLHTGASTPIFASASSSPEQFRALTIDRLEGATIVRHVPSGGAAYTSVAVAQEGPVFQLDGEIAIDIEGFPDRAALAVPEGTRLAYAAVCSGSLVVTTAVARSRDGSDGPMIENVFLVRASGEVTRPASFGGDGGISVQCTDSGGAILLGGGRPLQELIIATGELRR